MTKNIGQAEGEHDEYQEVPQAPAYVQPETEIAQNDDVPEYEIEAEPVEV